MTTALVKASTLVIMPTDASGDADTTKARNIEVSGAPTFADSYDTIERNVVHQAFSTYAPLRGLENTTATINVELHGSGDMSKAPEASLLYKSVFGGLVGPDIGDSWELIDDALSTQIATAPTWTVIAGTTPAIYTGDIVVDDASNFKEGFPVRIYTGSTLKVCGFISAISGNTLTVLTENNTTVDVDDTVDCGYLYVLKNLDDSQIMKSPEVNADYFRGNITKEAWSSLTPSSFDIDLSTGQICLPAFNFEGAEVGYSSEGYDYTAYTSINTTFDSENTSPVVIQLADIIMQDSADNFFQSCISNVQFTITNEVYKKLCIASKGVQETLRTSRSVTGSLNTFYENKDFQDAFKEDTTYKFRAIFNYASDLDASGNKVFKTEGGNIIAISVPQLKFSSVGVEEDSGIFKYNNSFSAEPIEGDDEIYMAFL